MPFLLIPFAYLLASLSPAYFAGKVNGIDMRKHGSGNLGATNAGRVLGAKWFAIVFTGDVLKGALPVAGAHVVGGDTWLLLATAAAAILGHVFTCFHGFKGGKAVATSLGVLAALVPVVAGCTLGVWLLAWIIGWRGFNLGKSSAVGPASVCAAIATPTFQITLNSHPFGPEKLPITAFLIALAMLVVVKHKSNIAKLFQPATPRTP